MEATPKKLFLLDAYALIYRAYYALIKSPRYTASGFNTSAIFGFCNTLDEVLRKENPSHIAVCFDPAGPTFRHEAYTEYKANRERQPEDITLSIPFIKDIISAKGITVIEIDGYEADDVIGTLSRKAEREGYITYMMTPDKDYGQLVTDKVLIYKPSLRGQDFEIRDVERIKEKYGINTPLQLIDILALEGDSIDNIPGCPGVGEKTARTLIEQFGSVENLIESTHELKGALKLKIENNREQIVFSKFLATIKTDVPFDIEIDQLKRNEENIAKLREIYERLEFRTLLARLQNKTGRETGNKKDIATPVIPDSLFDVPSASSSRQSGKEMEINARIWNVENHEETLTAIRAAKRLGVTVKSIGENAFTATFFALSVALVKQNAVYVEAPSPMDIEARQKFLELLGIVFGEDKFIVSTDIKRTYVLLNRLGIEYKSGSFDISLAHYLLDPESRHTLPEVAHNYLNYDTVEYGIEPRQRKPYALNDKSALPALLNESSCIALELVEPLEEALKKYSLVDLYHDIEMPLAFVLAKMEIAGVRIDTAELRKLSVEYTARLVEMEKKVYEIAGQTFNIGSPSQVGEILFGKMALDPKAKKTKKGTYSTTEEILEKYRAQHPIVDYILKIRQLKKLLATYIDALPEMVDSATGKIHTTFNQIVTTTGRLSSTNPNLQNIPVRGDDGREIRRAFIADPGCVFMSADYSQIELRLMADFSQDPNMLEAFHNKLDIHQDTASRIYHKKLEDVTPDERRNAKTANFGIIYGISPFGLSERLGIPKSEAKQLIDNYMATYPAIREYIDDIVAKAREQGYVTTFTGRRRILHEINSQNAVVRGYGERNAVNAPLQGSAADIIKIAMISIQKRLEKNRMKSQMIMQVHDELLFNVYPDELISLQLLVAEEMENAYNGGVRMETSIGTGKNWLEAH